MALALVLLLHTIAVWTLGSQPPERIKFKVASGSASVMTTRSIEGPSGKPEPVEANNPPIQAPVSRPNRSEVSGGASPSASIASPAISAAEVPVLDMSRFLPLDGVDTPAMPQEDWHVDQELLRVVDDQAALANESLRLVIGILVDANGATRLCSLEEPENLDANLARQLEDQLCSTPMSPAIRDGVAVGSVRKIEMVIGQ